MKSITSWLIKVIISVSIVLFLAAFGILYYDWLSLHAMMILKVTGIIILLMIILGFISPKRMRTKIQKALGF